MAGAENKVKFGVKNVHMNIVTNDTAGSVTWGEARKFPGAVSISIDNKVDSDDFWADDGQYFISDGIPVTELEFECANIPEWFDTEVLGKWISKDKTIVDDANAEFKKVALAFEFSGDKKAVRRRYFYCQPQPYSEDSKTIENGKKTPQTTKIKFAVMEVPGTTIKSDKTSADTTTANYDKWYTGAISLPVKNTTVSG